MGFSEDRSCMLPVTNVRQYFSRPNMSFKINVMPLSPQLLDIATGEAEGLFRIVRRLDVSDETDAIKKRWSNGAFDHLCEQLKISIEPKITDILFHL